MVCGKLLPKAALYKCIKICWLHKAKYSFHISKEFLTKLSNFTKFMMLFHIVVIFCLFQGERSINFQIPILFNISMLFPCTIVYFYLENIKFDSNRNVSIERLFFSLYGLTSTLAKCSMDHSYRIATTVWCCLERISSVWSSTCRNSNPQWYILVSQNSVVARILSTTIAEILLRCCCIYPLWRIYKYEKHKMLYHIICADLIIQLPSPLRMQGFFIDLYLERRRLFTRQWRIGRSTITGPYSYIRVEHNSFKRVNNAEHEYMNMDSFLSIFLSHWKEI